MKEIRSKTKNKELVVRKRVVAIIEKTLRVFGFDFSHDRYKEVIYEKDFPKSEVEEKLKRYYDGFMFLLNNRKTQVSSEFISRFYYLIKYEELDKEKSMFIASKYFYLNYLDEYLKALEFHLYVYQVLDNLEEYERTLISIMIFNYCLVRYEIPCIHMVRKDIARYIKYRDLYLIGKIDKLKVFMKEVILNAKFQDKNYTKKLKYITPYDIKKIILEEKERLKEEYGAISIMIFGSFLKGDYRIDSDIDLLVLMEEGIPLKKRREKIEGLSLYLEERFNRYVDIHEVFRYLTDNFIKETNEIKIIY